ncbi:MAG: twin-arginine translocation signal domain-containing protein [Acidobacteria bacterium]|nr:twin-arginine translocation signal domain-containing protein [Acidobacteriota bacterium]
MLNRRAFLRGASAAGVAVATTTALLEPHLEGHW